MKIVTFGRHPQNTVVVNDMTVGRNHAQITQHDDGHFTLLDLTSKNGTFVNGKLILGEVILRPDDVVQIGRTTLPWRNYFQNTNSVQHKKNIVLILVGTICGIVVTIVTFVLAFAILSNDSNHSKIAFQDSQYHSAVVTLEENGEIYEVDAIGGQVIVIFSNYVHHKDAVKIIKNNHAKIIAQMPNVHCYLVEVPSGKEGDLFSIMSTREDVNFVYPNVINPLCSAIPYVIDNFQVDHGEQVVSMMKGCNPTLDVVTYDVALDENKGVSSYTAMEKVEKVLDELSEDDGAVINLSFGPDLRRIGALYPFQNRVLWNDRLVSEGNKNSYMRRYVNDIKQYIKIVEPYNDKDFVIAKAAGNEGMKDMSEIINTIEKTLTSHELDVFNRHFLIVSANDDNKEGDYPNDVAAGTYNPMLTKVDISDMTAQDLHWQGTSFASPRVAGYIADIANKNNKKTVDVLQDVRNATKTSTNHTVTYELIEQSANTDLSEPLKDYKKSSGYSQYGVLLYRLIYDSTIDSEKLELRNTSDQDICVRGTLLNAIVPRGGANFMEFDEIVSANQTKFIDGFIENKCTINSVSAIPSHTQTTPTSNIRPQSYFAEINKEVKFTLEDGSNGYIDLYSMGLGDLWLKIYWSGYEPIYLQWRLDGHGIAPLSGSVSSECIASGRHYAYEKNMKSYRLSVRETFHWTSSDANVNGIEVYITPSK